MLVEGARCVGKSTVVEEFTRREYCSYILVDFAEASRDVHELFDDVSDLDYLFLQLQLRYSARLFDRELLIILDEVQMCLRVRRAIKQLVKDGRYDYIGTGSLVSIRRNTRDILIPSEEERAQMRPMDFDEFRWARGDDATVPLLRRAQAIGGEVQPQTHARLPVLHARGRHAPGRGRAAADERPEHGSFFEHRPGEVQTVFGGHRPVRDPRLQGRGLHRQHRVWEVCRTSCPWASAWSTRTSLPRSLPPTEGACSTTPGPSRERPATTRSTSSSPTARKSVPSRSSRRITGRTPHWMHSAESTPHASAGGTSSTPRTWTGTGRRLHPDLHVRVPIGRGTVCISSN